MRIEASAPGRCGIIGNPTDGYGGCVISCSLRERARVVLSTPGRELTVTVGGQSAVLGTRGDYRLKNDYFDCVRAVLSFLGRYDLNFHMDISTDIPLNSGLAGSTAVLASTLAAVLRMLGRTHRRHHFAEMLRVIELNYLKVQCGYQDQYMTVFGGLNYMDFRGKQLYRDLDEEFYATVEPLDDCVGGDLPFIVVQTGVQRVSGTILSPIRERWLDGDRDVVEGYERIAALCLRAKRSLIDRDWNTLARLINETHGIQRALGASGEANDRLIEAALNNGALAAKLAGAGGGGSIIVLTFEPDRMAEALRKHGAARVIYPMPSPGLACEVVEK
jgi:galactokinase/mevalonate kinase-like predicted kinase